MFWCEYAINFDNLPLLLKIDHHHSNGDDRYDLVAAAAVIVVFITAYQIELDI